MGASERTFWRCLPFLRTNRVIIDTRRNGCHPNSYLLDPERILSLAAEGKAERREKVRLLEESARTTWRELADQARAEQLEVDKASRAAEGDALDEFQSPDSGHDSVTEGELDDETPEAAADPAAPPAWLLEAIRRRADWSNDRVGWSAKAWGALSLVFGRLVPTVAPEALGHLRRRSLRWWVDQGAPSARALAPRLELILSGLDPETGCTKAGPLPVLRALPEEGRLRELLLGSTWAEAEAQAQAHHDDGCRCDRNAVKAFTTARDQIRAASNPVISIPAVIPAPAVRERIAEERSAISPEDRGARRLSDLALPFSYEGSEARAFKVRDGVVPSAWSVGLKELRYVTDAEGQVWAVATNHRVLASARLHLVTLERILPELVGIVS